MPEILYLTHRIPYPPNKGDKIRSYHWLRYLADRFTVHLGTFVDDPDDMRHVQTLRQWCGECFVAPLNARTAKLRSAKGLLSGEPLTLPYYRHAGLRRWVDRLVNQGGVSCAIAFSGAMAQYLLPHAGLHRVVDLVDLDSDKWRQYADSHRGAMAWLYRRESRRLLAFESRVARDFDATALVSEEEASLFRQLAPEAARRVQAISNGVDTDYFDPSHDYPAPGTGPTSLPLVFTGAMDYWPNIDAVVWFARDILPKVREMVADAELWIVGGRPSAEVTALEALPGVRVVGRVPDVRPFLAHAAVAVAPLRVARGLQNKVLEAMAMALPVVTTTQGLEGLSARPGEELLVADDPESFAAAVTGCAGSRGKAMGSEARRRVLQDYQWATRLECLGGLLDPAAAVVQATPPLAVGAAGS